MTVAQKLRALFKAIADEVETNPGFGARVSEILGEGRSTGRRGKRDPAILDPIALWSSEGEVALRAKLGGLSVDQLKDIVSEYGMDKSHLAMKWTRPERLIEHIVTTSSARARKGDAFR